MLLSRVFEGQCICVKTSHMTVYWTATEATSVAVQ